MRFSRSSLCLVALALAVRGEAFAQSLEVHAVRSYRASHAAEIVEELVGFLSLPNVASDIPAIRRNAETLLAMMARRGIEGRLLETDGPPYVYGELNVPGATRTILFYAHYDGQPVDPSRWIGHDPYEPVLRDGALEGAGQVIEFPPRGYPYQRDWRIYARSAADDKSPIVAMLVALDGLAAGLLRPAANLKFIFEGDEEAGSPNLGNVVREYRDLLAADLAIVADGPTDPSGLPTMKFGARGIVSAEITVYGPLRPLHSGHYGNWAPNPAMRLAQLLASMKDPQSGRVLVDGFYDDVVELTELERAAIAAAPNDDADRMHAFAIAEPEAQGRRLALVNLPSLNVRGLRSAWVGGEARTVVPDRAIASIDLRLVKNIDPGDQLERLIAHIERQGYEIVSEEPDPETRRRHPKLARVVTSDGYPAYRTPMDLPIARALVSSVEEHMGQSIVKIPTSGGSVPLFWFTDVLGVPTVGVPIVNHDNNQHGPNENLRLGNLWSGIELLASVMMLR
ncbi:MAG: M20/M25/M40 family metallo-hydrolase [Gemmatimonadota bacterium]|nr:MAG: M20/M25/M40 family metallo-hydrolase [Gemmatimonadota bacterium]